MARFGLAASVAALTVSFPLLSHAQPVVSDPNTATAGEQTARYWTGVRMQNARPRVPTLEPSHVTPSAAMPRAQPSTAADGQKVEGAPPTVRPEDRPPAVTRGATLTPEQMAETYGNPEAIPAATSRFGLPFTTSRVEPENERTSYPFMTAGKLFFSEQGVGDFICSGSVGRRGIIMTAGHCVYQPKTATQAGHFFTNFLFVPAYDNGTRPVGSWTAIQEGTTAEWASGAGTVPNAQDVGMIVANQNGDQMIGDVTGYLGYFTQQLAGNNVTMIGYPANLDNGEKMERTDAGNSVFGGNNTYAYGSAAAGGASGGPWVQDFGLNPVSTGAQTWHLGLNYLIAVTSYGPAGDSGYLGASNLNQSFLNLVNLLCSLHTNAC